MCEVYILYPYPNRAKNFSKVVVVMHEGLLYNADFNGADIYSAANTWFPKHGNLWLKGDSSKCTKGF